MKVLKLNIIKDQLECYITISSDTLHTVLHLAAHETLSHSLSHLMPINILNFADERWEILT